MSFSPRGGWISSCLAALATFSTKTSPLGVPSGPRWAGYWPRSAEMGVFGGAGGPTSSLFLGWRGARALLPPRPARPAHHAAGGGAGGLSVLEHLDAVDPDLADAGRVLVGLLVGGVVGDRRRVEDHHVGVVAGGEAAAVVELQVL